MSEPEESDRYSRAFWLRRPGFDTPLRPDDQPPRPPGAPKPPVGTLVSSANGALTRIALALPAFYFQQAPDAILLNDLLRKLNLELYAKVLRTLPEGCEAVVVSNALEQAKAFVEQERPNGPNVYVEANDGHTTWIQDPFCAVTAGGVTRLVEPRSFREPLDQQLADVIAVDRSLARIDSDDLFEGGNVLAGTEHWFLGADSGGALAAGGDISGLESAFAEIGAGRKLVLVHSTVAVPTVNSKRQRVGVTEGPELEEVFARNEVGTTQPLFHIDAFMTVAIDADGREVVLLGSPKEARKFIVGGGNWPEDVDLEAVFESVHDVIKAQAPSLRIIPLPMPVFGVDTAKVRRWRYATYANALLQRDAEGRRTAWLPTFKGEGEHEWTAVGPVDDEVERIYREELGYETVHRLPDCRAFAYYLGGPHCVFNYLARA